MLNYKKKPTDGLAEPSSASLATILSAKTQVPLGCDNCGIEQNHSIEHLRQLPQLNCRHCEDERVFSQFELTVLENTLKDMGFYLAN